MSSRSQREGLLQAAPGLGWTGLPRHGDKWKGPTQIDGAPPVGASKTLTRPCWWFIVNWEPSSRMPGGVSIRAATQGDSQGHGVGGGGPAYCEYMGTHGDGPDPDQAEEGDDNRIGDPVQSRSGTSPPFCRSALLQ